MGLFFRILFKMFTPLCIIAGLSFYGLYLQGKDPLAAFKSQDEGPSLVSQISQSLNKAKETVSAPVANISAQKKAPPKQRAIYKWVNESGTVTFGTSPPANAKNLIKVRTVAAAPDAPTPRATPKVAKTPEPPSTASQASAQPQAANELLQLESITDIYKPENLKQLLNQAKDIQSIMQQRQEVQQQLLNQ